jgi:hypothetical protein
VRDLGKDLYQGQACRMGVLASKGSKHNAGYLGPCRWPLPACRGSYRSCPLPKTAYTQDAEESRCPFTLECPGGSRLSRENKPFHSLVRQSLKATSHFWQQYQPHGLSDTQLCSTNKAQNPDH